MNTEKTPVTAPVDAVVSTPGPWKVYGGPGRLKHHLAVIDSIPDVAGKVVANCICHVATTNPDSDGNAVLIAAAPELADALRELHDFAVTDPHYRYGDRSLNAFVRAAELLKRVGF